MTTPNQGPVSPDAEDIKRKEPVWVGRPRRAAIPRSVQAKIERSIAEAQEASAATGTTVEPEGFPIRYMTRAKTGNEVRIHKATDPPNRAQRRFQEKMMRRSHQGPRTQKPKRC